MNRRNFLAGAVVVGTTGVAGCMSETNHQEELRSEIERRDVEVHGMEVEDGTIRVEYESENTNDDLAAVAMAFVERVDGGWQVDRLEGFANEEPSLRWHAETVWAREYLDGRIDAGEYGERISRTLEPTVIVGGEEGSASE